MLVISTREFRDKQKSYLDKVDSGIQVLILRGKNKSYRLLPVTEDDTLMSKEDFMTQVNKGKEQIRDGQYKVLTPEYKKTLLGL
jgi:AMMECR1 domain-containing protein